MKKALLFGPLATTLIACASQPEDLIDIATVEASAETAAMAGYGDRADDPALWVDPDRPGESLVLGTNKTAGLYIYDLEGRERQKLLFGRLNNVDLRGTAIVASNDGRNAISWFRVGRRGNGPEVWHIGDTPLGREEPYGICLGDIDGKLITGVTYKDGTVELWQTAPDAEWHTASTRVRAFSLPSQPEGCVFDDANARIFIGEEEHGIWSADVRSDAAPVLVDSIAQRNGLVADVEGLSMYEMTGGRGFLVASAQGADRFVVYDRTPPHGVRGVFRIGANTEKNIDAVTHTDGLHVSAVPLPGYPQGVLIVQDDGNPDPEQDQNFKIVDWRDVVEALGLMP
ncbi:MAG: phytase [Pseudomonadota bacterium]